MEIVKLISTLFLSSLLLLNATNLIEAKSGESKMKINKKHSILRGIVLSITVGALLCITFVISSHFSVMNAEGKKYVTVTNNNLHVTLIHKPFIRNGEVYVPVQDVGKWLDMQVFWNEKQNKIYLNHPSNKLSISAPLILTGVAYVPCRKFKTIRGIEVTWDTNLKIVDISYTSRYVTITDPLDTYWLERTTGALYHSKKSQAIESMGHTIVRQRGYLGGGMTRLSDQAVILTFNDAYGEPMLNDQTYKLLVKNKNLALQTGTRYYGFHPIRTIQQTQSKDHILLNGKWLYIVNKRGDIMQKHDLQVLTGYKDDAFQIESYDNEYIIARPHRSGWLFAINLKTKKAVRLIDRVASPEQLKIYNEYFPNNKDSFEFRDWDGLTFKKRVGNNVQLTHRWFLDSSKLNTVTVDLNSI